MALKAVNPISNPFIDTLGAANLGATWQSSWPAEQNRPQGSPKQPKQQPAPPHTPFFISEAILQATAHHPQTQSQLLQLPPEILILIVEKLSIPYFQVILGLTCKSIASLLSLKRSKLSQWRGFKDKEGLYRLLSRQGRVGPHILASPSVMPPTTQTVVLKTDTSLPAYIPPHLRLCRACFRYVPRNQSYWLAKLSHVQLDLNDPNVNWSDILNFFDNSDRNDGQHKCPECCVNGNSCFMNERQYLRAIEEDELDEESGCVTERGQRVRVGLPERMERP